MKNVETGIRCSSGKLRIKIMCVFAFLRENDIIYLPFEPCKPDVYRSTDISIYQKNTSAATYCDAGIFSSITICCWNGFFICGNICRTVYCRCYVSKRKYYCFLLNLHKRNKK